VTKRETKLPFVGVRPVGKGFPKRISRKDAAEIVSHLHFPISSRTIERWPLIWRRVNGRALVDTEELLAEAQRRVDAAPPIMGGQI